MPLRRPNLLLLNASLAGEGGNTAVLLERVRRLLARRAVVEVLTLAALPGVGACEEDGRLGSISQLSSLNPQLRSALARADGFLIGTGTHWDSWSSVLQRFLEEATALEGTGVWLGKPAAVVVTEHSVGGKGVLSRLQGVLVTLGCSLPPMSGLVLSRAALLAGQHEPEAAKDFWCEEDLAVVAHNLAEAARVTLPGAKPVRPRWWTWPVDRKDFSARWVE